MRAMPKSVTVRVPVVSTRCWRASDVAMDDAALVEEIERFKQLLSQRYRFQQRPGCATGVQLAQRFAGDQLHGHEHRCGSSPNSQDGNDMLVRQPDAGVGLAAKPRQHLPSPLGPESSDLQGLDAAGRSSSGS